MSVIVYQWGTEHVDAGKVEVKDCDRCGGKKPFHYLVEYSYAGLFWIFNFLTSKRHLVVCDTCKTGREVQPEEYPHHAQNARVPFMRRFGIFVLVALVALIVCYS
jgi:hypothetical protein